MKTQSPVNPKQTLQIYWQHSKKYPKSLAVIAFGTPIIQLIDDFAVPFLTSIVLTKIVKSDGTLHLQDFLPYIAAILGIELAVNFLWIPFVKVVWRFEEDVMRDLYATSFRHLMQMSYTFYSNRFGGSLVNQVNKFSGSFERLADTLIWSVYKLVIAFVFTAILLVKPAPLYVLVLTVFTSIYVTLLIRLKRNERSYNEKWAAAESDRTGQLADSITNIVAVKSFAHEKLEASLYDRKLDGVYDISIATMKKVMNNERLTTTAQRAINGFSILVAIVLGVKFNISVGIIYLILNYTLNIARRLWDLNNVIRNMNRIFGDARDMTTILQLTPEVAEASGAKKLIARRGGICFNDVVFGHKDVEQALFNNLSLKIKPGEKIGLVGPSGGGKTTLTKLLLRFMDVQAGTITIDGQDIAGVTQQSLRSAIAYVPQEPLMFHRSLMDNIRYGQLDASDEAVVACAKQANAHSFIVELPDGYDTLVGERGTKLSGGQRQRIAIARAMLKNAPLLVLDEATSALDSESEVLIQDALWKLMKDRTAIVIAHRLSTIQKMDRIVVLDEGTIVEQGSHKELLARNGAYAKLWQHQSGGFVE